MTNSSAKASDQTIDVSTLEANASSTTSSQKTNKDNESISGLSSRSSNAKSRKGNTPSSPIDANGGGNEQSGKSSLNDHSQSFSPGVALGMIETRGLVPAIEAADAMTKAAEVSLISREFVGGGYVSVLVRGETGAVNASVRAGADACERVGDGLVAAHIIARPHKEVEPVLKITKRVRRG
tara:strand:+ start:155 stop:697 length:543 start_codon:yes stop_codon:yes gene_type:complete